MNDITDYSLIFTLIFPLVLLALLIIIIVSSIPKRKQKQEFMSLDDFIKDWLKDHGQAHKLEKQFAKMKKDPSGLLYMPATYGGAKICIRLGLSPNKVSFMNLILSFFILWGVVMASAGHTLGLLTQQPLYGSWFLVLGLLVLFTGTVDGIDGAIARLLNIKSKRGAWLDNVIDRVSDILMIVCVIPTTLLIIPAYGFDFTWIAWTNAFLILLYEYMRAKHEGLGLHESKPFIGEKITRVLVIGTFFLCYGISSLAVLLTNLINPSLTIWNVSHTWVVTWIMLIYQISLAVIMIISMILSTKYIWINLKKIDNME